MPWISNMYMRIMMPTLYIDRVTVKRQEIKMIKKSLKFWISVNNLGDNLMSFSFYL